MKKYHLHNRPNRELKEETEINEILLNGKFAVISMCRNNEPYIVSLSYGYDLKNKCLYFHCATEGLKLDFIAANKKVCATVIEDKGYIQGECAHEYKTAVFWGEMFIVEDNEEKKHGMNILLEHLEKKEDIVENLMLKSEKVYAKMNILKLNIDEIHAKAGR
ncbi:flavin-nucleotide-binding protein [Labilibacter sediminis]|nr:flavin-nucleotide-binding protein [Labilibacter sediminis]